MIQVEFKLIRGVDLENVFEKEMQRESIFKNRNVLSPYFVPDILPHREKELESMMKTLTPALRSEQVHNIFLYGKTGTGKTCVTKKVVEQLLKVKEKYNASIDSVYVNCRILNTKYQVVLKCAEYCSPEESFIGFPFATLFDKILKFVSGKKLNFIIILDEIDKVKDFDDLVYTLTRANDELENGHLSIIGITNNINFKQQLDPRSRSTLCEEEFIFTPYNAEQLQNILEERVKEGYKENAVEESAINLAAALAAKESGDARYALKLILKAGEYAESSNQKKVIEENILQARKGVEEEIVNEIVSTLPEHQKIVLHAMALLSGEAGGYRKLDDSSDEEGGKTLFSGEVYEKYSWLCKKQGQKPRSARWAREYINDLEMLGIITTTLSGKGVRGNTTLIKLAFPEEKIRGILEKKMSE